MKIENRKKNDRVAFWEDRWLQEWNTHVFEPVMENLQPYLVDVVFRQ